MTLEQIRAFCLALPDATEDIKWENHLCFCIGGKMFAVTTPDEGIAGGMTLKAAPARLAELLEVEGIARAAYVGRYGWITLARLDTVEPAEMRTLLRESYDEVASKLSRKKKAAPAKTRKKTAHKRR